MWDFTSGLHRVGKTYGDSGARPDAIVISSPHPFPIFAGHALARRFNAKLIFEIRDIWPLSLTKILGVPAWHPFVQMCAYAEHFGLQHADLVTSVLPRAAHYLADRGYRKKAFAWVPNGIDLKAARPANVSSEAGQIASAKLVEWREQGKVTIIYTGSIGTPNGIDLLLKALEHGSKIGQAGRCATLVVGRGEQLDALRAFATEKQLTDIYFSGWVPRDDANALLAQADIGYAGLRNIEALFGYGISPNKIADYFAAALPVLLPIAPCGDPVSESGGGIVRRAETPEAVWAALYELIRLSEKERQKLGALGRAYMEQKYDYDVIAGHYATAINQLPSPDSGGLAQ